MNDVTSLLLHDADGVMSAGSLDCLETLNRIIEERALTALFQPILDMGSGAILGFEGLIRGPSDSPLHAPGKLFPVARQFGLAFELESLCRQVVVERFVELGLPGMLFLNVSPDVLLQHDTRGDREFVPASALAPSRVVIELTENEPSYDCPLDMLVAAAADYRGRGFKVAIDDLGEGYSSLRLWSELRPDYVKIDRHFIQNIDKDPVKAQFVRAIKEIADNAGSRVIAEGIETHAELVVVRGFGVCAGQGYHIARPSASPSTVVAAEVAKALSAGQGQRGGARWHNAAIERKLLRRVDPVQASTPNDEVYRRFEQNPDLDAVPVVREDGTPVGLINRHLLVDRFARPYHRELYGKKPCTVLMDAAPLVVDTHLTVQELSTIGVGEDRRHLANGFIITDRGRYLGMGLGHDLMREITELQLSAARYANPLTQLPGNVPVNERIEQLLAAGAPFCVAYCDLDHFKPFNDVYGFAMGDEIIRLTGRLLCEAVDASLDFVGHIGGDDFILVLRSGDWEDRCRHVLERFGREVTAFFSDADRERGGYVTENRKGEKEFHPLTTLSIGAVRVEPGVFDSCMALSSVASETKKMAKKIPGNSLYLNRRSYRAE
jgi:EAL domain-containing protein (putative c-di-GMP-specific phosphodiesterase class I)/GGDEF domain-containing protein